MSIPAMILAGAILPLDPCGAGAVQPCNVLNAGVVVAETGAPRRLSWGASDEATMNIRYEVQWLEWKPVLPAGQLPVASTSIPEGQTRSWNWTPLKAGIYYARVRACNIGVTPNECSAWSVSLDTAAVDPARFPRGFVLYVRIAAPTGGGI